MSWSECGGTRISKVEWKFREQSRGKHRDDGFCKESILAATEQKVGSRAVQDGCRSLVSNGRGNDL